MCIEVTAAVVLRNDCVLIARRSGGKREAGKWEFPGGKREDGESLGEALYRELLEEFGVESVIHEELVRSRHEYPHGCIELIALRTDLVENPKVMADHDRIEWVPLVRLWEYDLAPADVPVARFLCNGLMAKEKP